MAALRPCVTIVVFVVAGCGGGPALHQEGDTVTVSTGAVNGGWPALAADATGWGVGWETEGLGGALPAVHFARIDAQGIVSGQLDVPDAWEARVRASGDRARFGMSWRAYVAQTGNADVYMREVGGAAPGATTRMTTVAETTYGVTHHDLVATGSGWAVAYCYERTANEMVVAFAGADLTTAGPCRSVSAAWDGSQTWLAYDADLPGGETGVFLRAVAGAGVAGEEIRVSEGTAGALEPLVAVGDGEVAVLYADVDNGRYAVHRFDRTGRSVGQVPVDLAGDATAAGLAWSGAAWGAAWAPGPNADEAFGLRFRSFERDVSPRQGPIAVRTFHGVRPESPPVLAPLGGVMGVAFADQDGSEPIRVYFARVVDL